MTYYTVGSCIWPHCGSVCEGKGLFYCNPWKEDHDHADLGNDDLHSCHYGALKIMMIMIMTKNTNPLHSQRKYHFICCLTLAKNIISNGQAAEHGQHVGLCTEEEDMICGTFPASAPSVNTTNSTSPIPSMNSTTGPKCECGFYCPASSSMSVVAFMKIFIHFCGWGSILNIG